MCQLKINNIGNLDLSIRPETYKTILQDKYGKNSLATSLRRKMSAYIKYGFICCKPIKYSSKRYGKEVIFYTLEKDYFIVFTKDKVFYCDNINTDDNYIELVKSHELKDNSWINRNNIKVGLEEVVLCF